MFGYYIETTKTHADRAPADYERKQTLVGAERFTTPASRNSRRKILSAESGLKELEPTLRASRVISRRIPPRSQTAAVAN